MESASDDDLDTLLLLAVLHKRQKRRKKSSDTANNLPCVFFCFDMLVSFCRYLPQQGNPRTDSISFSSSIVIDCLARTSSQTAVCYYSRQKVILKSARPDHVNLCSNLTGRTQRIERKDRLEVYPCVQLRCVACVDRNMFTIPRKNATQRNATASVVL